MERFCGIPHLMAGGFGVLVIDREEGTITLRGPAGDEIMQTLDEVDSDVLGYLMNVQLLNTGQHTPLAFHPH